MKGRRWGELKVGYRGPGNLGMCVRHVILLIWPTDRAVRGSLSCECGVARPSVKGQPVDVKQSILHAWHQPRCPKYQGKIPLTPNLFADPNLGGRISYVFSSADLFFADAHSYLREIKTPKMTRATATREFQGYILIKAENDPHAAAKKIKRNNDLDLRSLDITSKYAAYDAPRLNTRRPAALKI